MRDTGGGFGQKVLPMREDMCVALAAMRLARPRSSGSKTAGRTSSPRAWDVTSMVMRGWRSTRRSHRRARSSTTSRTSGRTRRHGQSALRPRSACCSRARTACRALDSARHRCSRTRRDVLRTEGRGSSSHSAREVLLDIAARRMRDGSGRAAAPQPAATGRPTVQNPNGMPYSDITPLETFEQALTMLDYAAFRRKQAAVRAAGRYLGVGHLHVRRTDDDRNGVLRDRRRDDPHRTIGQGQRLRRRWLDAGTASRRRSVQLAADALGLDIADVRTIQGDTALTPFGAGTGRQPQRLHARRRGGRDRRRATRTDHRHRRAPSRGLAGRHRARREPARVRGTPTAAISLAEIAEIAYFKPLETSSWSPGRA